MSVFESRVEELNPSCDPGLNQERPRTRRASPLGFFLLLLGTVGLGSAFQYYLLSKTATVVPRSLVATYNEDPELIWETIPSSNSDKLIWVACYDSKQCARLMVPLDYADPDGPKAGIAMVKVPSKVSADSAEYRGPILFNPGGPGGSGVSTVNARGELFQRVLGDDYDMIGFDPRGVGRTTPQVVIFPDDAESTAWDLGVRGDQLPSNASLGPIARIHARSALYGALAQERTISASPYVSTALVSRDMLSIVRAHGFEKLQYWGFSYGTVLGATFAAMFPDNVGRLIIDGVEDSEDYYAALWSNNLVDTDAVLDWFFESCAEAGPEACALHESSAEKIKSRLNSLYESLKYSPIPVSAKGSDFTAADYGLVDYALVRKLIFGFLYAPYPGMRPGGVTPSALASALAAAENGNGLPLWDLQKNGTEQFKCKCGGGANPVPRTDGATVAIACGEGDVVEDSVEELQAHYEKMSQDSTFAELWTIHASCVGWKIRTVERFSGPFVGNTSHPVLLIGNTADPVTPLRNAHYMAKGFNGSVVLTQNSPGHCSLSSSSPCTMKAVREYFRNGTLPKAGTVCETESTMFGDVVTADTVTGFETVLSSEDQEVLRGWRDLSSTFEPIQLGMI